jgi:hypothetical protein
MTELLVAGLDSAVCRQVAQRLRVLAQRAGLPVAVRVTSDAIDVQRLGKVGACTLLVDGRKVAENPFGPDADLAMSLASWVSAPAGVLAATA